jgi:cellulose synthase/poly-beta-1,6-N-acetylglucosamine synthase-like glycosyltransferase
MIIPLWLAAIAYILIITILVTGIKRNRHITPKTDQDPVTIIVPARNEESSLHECLNALVEQHFPKEKTQIFVVDDFSSDQTLAIAANYSNQYAQIKVIQRKKDVSRLTPKKSAIAQGIAVSGYDIIMNTDADCQPHPEWIKTINKYFSQNVGAVSSWLVVQTDHRLLSFIESIDSFSYVLIGAAAIGWGKPLLANGANFSYRKVLFNRINGFDGIGKFGSGDDDLLLQKMVNDTEYKIRFALEPEATVRTRSCRTIKQFMKQRIRWASKTSVYSDTLGWLFLPIIAYLCLFIFSPLIIFAWPQSILPLIFFWITKFTADFIVQTHFRRKLGLRTPFHTFMIAEFLQILYLPIVGLWGIRGRFEWKGRSYIKGQLEQQLTKK